jgi:hypothetical protein
MIRQVSSYLTRLENETEEQMRSPLDLQFLNWLEVFLKEVYDAGAEDSDIATREYDRGYHDGYNEAKEEFEE